MKRLLLTLLASVVILGLFASVGYTGYRLGLAQGTQSFANGQGPEIRPFDRFGPREMPGHGFGFERGFPRGFGMQDFPMRGFGIFSLLRFLGFITVLALLVGIVYWLLTQSGWRLVHTVQTVQTTQTPVQTVETIETETKE